jgi:predicted DNA binding CopG/RHH family protein
LWQNDDLPRGGHFQVFSKNRFWTRMKQGQKPFTLRVPLELLNAIRKKAAEETIKRNKLVSINTLSVEMLSKAVGLKEKKITG